MVTQELQDAAARVEGQAAFELNEFLSNLGKRMIADGEDESAVLAGITSAATKTGIASMAHLHGVSGARNARLTSTLMQLVNRAITALAV